MPDSRGSAAADVVAKWTVLQQCNLDRAIMDGHATLIVSRRDGERWTVLVSGGETRAECRRHGPEGSTRLNGCLKGEGRGCMWPREV